MKQLTNVMSTLSKATGKTVLTLKAVSPEIMLGIGVVGVIASTVLACKATLKVDAIIAEHRENKEKIAEIWEDVQNGDVENYTEKDKNKDLAVTYTHTVGSLVKVYGPAVALGVASFALIIGGHSILKKRNLALIAAYQTLEKGFAAYRKRVVEEFGEEKDYMFKNNLRKETIVEEVTDEKGKTKMVKKEVLVPKDPNSHSIYAKFFDESSCEFQKSPDYNFSFLKTQQAYWNNMLQIRGHVFLNEVYDALDIPRTQAGAVVGWVLNKDGDNFIDFGIFDGDRAKVRDFVNGYEKAILLDFNVDGVVYDRLP